VKSRIVGRLILGLDPTTAGSGPAGWPFPAPSATEPPANTTAPAGSLPPGPPEKPMLYGKVGDWFT